MFGGRVSAEHRAHVTDWWVEVMGGPGVYTERHGGYERMLARHRNLAITAEQRLAFVMLLSGRAYVACTGGIPLPPFVAATTWPRSPHRVYAGDLVLA